MAEKSTDKKKKKQEMFLFFHEIWKEREHYCQSCGKWLGDNILSYFFDHLLEKSKYPNLVMEKENIFLCCGDCHTEKTNGFPSSKHKKAIDEAKLKFLNNGDRSFEKGILE